MPEPLPRPSYEVVNQDEQRALRLAVKYALDGGIATDDLGEGQAPSNRSLVSLGRKLGVTIPEWCEEHDES